MTTILNGLAAIAVILTFLGIDCESIHDGPDDPVPKTAEPIKILGDVGEADADVFDHAYDRVQDSKPDEPVTVNVESVDKSDYTSEDPAESFGTSFIYNNPYFTDPRDGQTYRIVRIGNRTWMAENLNYKAVNSSCYDNDEFNCKKYGRLYGWGTAMSVCPIGWRLPSSAEWDDLVQVAGGSAVAGKMLKSKTQWNGMDKYNFAALPGGYRRNRNSFSGVGSYGGWWSATDNTGSQAHNRSMRLKLDRVNGDSHHKGYSYSVRCVQE